MESINEIGVFVGEALKCQVFISNEEKLLNLVTARTKVMEVVKDFLPDSYIFTKRVGDVAIPVATGQENLVSLEKCIVEDGKGALNLYVQEAAKRGPPSASSSMPKPKRMRQASLVKFLNSTDTKDLNSTADYSAARGRVFLFTTSTIERATARRREYYEYWNEKAEELCSSPSFNNYSKRELHGIIDSHWRMHATSLCIRDAEEEQQLVNSLSQELRGSKLLLSAKTVNKNLDLLKEEDRKIKSVNRELTSLRAGTKTLEDRKAIQNKEKELQNCLTDLKLTQERLRKSIDGLSKSRNKALASGEIKGGKKRSAESSSEFKAENESCEQLDISEDEEQVLAEEAKSDGW